MVISGPMSSTGRTRQIIKVIKMSLNLNMILVGGNGSDWGGVRWYDHDGSSGELDGE